MRKITTVTVAMLAFALSACGSDAAVTTITTTTALTPAEATTAALENVWAGFTHDEKDSYCFALSMTPTGEAADKALRNSPEMDKATAAAWLDVLRDRECSDRLGAALDRAQSGG